MNEYGIDVCEAPENKMYDGIILAVPHRQFIELGHEGIKNFGNQGSVFYDVKVVFQKIVQILGYKLFWKEFKLVIKSQNLIAK